MQVIIEIPEEVKRAFECAESNDLKGCYYDHGGVIGNAIKNATPLPKGHDNATPLTDCTDAISREEVIKASSKLCVSDECCKCQFDENTKCRLKSYRNYIRTLPSVNPTTDLRKIRAEIESMDFDFGHSYDNTNDIIEMVCKVIDKYKGGE